MKIHLIESHLKNNWYVDLWSDGTIEVFTHSKLAGARFGHFHKLPKDIELYRVENLPKYVRQMVGEAIELRYFYRLGENP